ncbi:putative mitochondrial inner membrane protein [Scheffersomyces coipomensis]|uniref:putative mitochondrial inner membrane protein n=1 Tax=Scheffersomyces coipomensis TaxID=1788519 RepID=UPI00315CDE6E
MLRAYGRSPSLIRSFQYGLPNHIQKRKYTMEIAAIVGSMTESMQALHTMSGMPWWALIPLTTFGLRSVWTLPLAILQRKRVRKQSQLRPIISAMNPVLRLNLARKSQLAKMAASEATGTEAVAVSQSPLANMSYEQILILASKETRKRQKALFKKNDVQLWKNMILPAFQIPLWVAMSVCMRDLSGWTSWDNLSNKALDPALYKEGLLWFTDLTTADQLHAFPLILGIVALCNVEWTFKTFELLRPSQRKRLRPTLTDAVANISRMAVVFLMSISLHAPTALTLYWLSSQFYSLVQNIIMDIVLPVSFTTRNRVNYSKSRNPDAINVINENKLGVFKGNN